MYNLKSKEHKYKKLQICTILVISILILSSNLLFTKYKPKDNKLQKNGEEINENIENSKYINEEKIKQNLANLKGYFTKNQGQLENDEIYFTFTTQDKTFGFKESFVIIKLTKKLEDNKTKSSTIELTFENSNKVVPKGIKELSHKSNYFIGNDSSKWKNEVANFEKIVYENLYDGIDLVYYFNEKGLKYDWIVKPYVELSNIVEKFEGIDSIDIDSNGGLIIKSEGEELREEMPFSYQEICGNIFEVDVSFSLFGDALIYEIGDYDSSKDLIIDPLIYSTFIGESNDDKGFGIALGSEKNIFLIGTTSSLDFPTTIGCFNDTKNEKSDVFVLKLNQDCSDLLYSTFIGGKENDVAKDIVVDSENNSYIIGYTKSSDFPTSINCYDDILNGMNDIFIFKLNWKGSNLIYSTFIGGDYQDYPNAVELDNENNTYITGETTSIDFPTSSNCYDDIHNGQNDVFVFKLDWKGADMIYSTFVGGDNDEYGNDIALDSKNNACITGETKSSDFPTTPNCYDDSKNGYLTAFLFKLNSDATDFYYSTFIGGEGWDCSKSIAIDSNNNTYITGNTDSEDFPTTLSCYDNSLNVYNDVFVCKLNWNGSSLLGSTFIGGNDGDSAYGINLDFENEIYITGYTKSLDFPTTSDCYNDSLYGDYDVFVSKLNNDCSQLIYSTYIGGSDSDRARNIALDSENNVYISGRTNSFDFPTSSRCFDDSYNGGWDVFVFKLHIERKEHDISIDAINAPDFFKLNETTKINGTIKNIGQNNETNIQVQLLINDTVENQTTVSQLNSNESKEIIFNWKPTKIGEIKIGFHVLPVPNENISSNNWKNKTITVFGNTDIRIQPTSYDIAIEKGVVKNLNLTIENIGLNDLFFNINDNVSEDIPIIETFSDVSKSRKGTDNKCNVYYVTKNVTLSNFEVFFSSLTTLNLTFMIYEGNSHSGTYKRTYESNKEFYESSASFKSIGSINIPLYKGKYYVMVFKFSEAATYYYSNSPELKTCSFGQLIGGSTLLGILSPTRNFYPSSTLAYYERLTTRVRDTECDWLTEQPLSGIVNPNKNTTITLTINTTKLEPNYYQGNITIINNDPDESEIKVAVNLTVLASVHDIRVISINASKNIKAGEQVIVNATILNQGINNETNIEIQLKVDSIVRTTVTIPSLKIGNLQNVTLGWTPVITGKYFIEIYAVPVIGEIIIYNNVLNTTINVTGEPNIWINPESYNIEMQQNEIREKTLTIGNDGFGDLEYYQ